MKTAPTATPPTMVPVRNRAIDAWDSPATTRARAARNTMSPQMITIRLGKRASTSWVAVAAANRANTTAPPRAWPWECRTLPRKLGASALNMPSREKAANPATPAAMNSLRPAFGMPRPANRRFSFRRSPTVSGTKTRPMAAAASTAR